MSFLTPERVASWSADPPCTDGGMQAKSRARATLAALDLATPGQQMGQRWAVGCVALEITQRCNLDCSACYLSEHSEAVRDLPLASVFERIDAIAAHYGPMTDVQITGGDPTLRDADELAAIVARVAAHGLRPTLMTNGIKASPALLARLSAAGLVDVAFHVDTTQARKGYTDEQSLHALRDRYIRNARAAGLSVMFNTTLHAGNYHELPELVRYFVQRAPAVRTASFQLQADTGRGVLRQRVAAISTANTIATMEAACGTKLGFGVSGIGHPECTAYALMACAGDRVVALFDEPQFVRAFQAATADLVFHRNRPLRTLIRTAARLLTRPALAGRALLWLLRKLRLLLAAARNRSAIHTLSFVIHDFMDASCLSEDRVHACAFKVMTQDGPMSMCVANARRDSLILEPVVVPSKNERRYWDPLSGSMSAQPRPISVDVRMHPLKRLKGRARAAALEARRVQRATVT